MLIMKKYRIIQSLCCFILMLLMVTACNNDNTNEIDGIFRPKIVTGYPIANANTIKVLWYDITDAKSYTIQLAFQQDYSDVFLEEEVTDVSYVTPKLPYATKIYLRVKANSNRNNYESAWREFEATTEERDIPRILHEIDDIDIKETEVTIHWEMMEGYPVDSIAVVCLNVLPGGGYPAPVEIKLTAEEAAAASYTITGLTKTTDYRVTLFNSAAESYERAYNSVEFKTAGPPQGSIEITMKDDFSTILQENQINPDIADGQVYYITESGEYAIEGFEFTKGFSVVAGIGIDVTLNIKSPFYPNGKVGELKFKNLQLTGEKRLIENPASDGKDYNWEGVNIDDCTLSGFEGGLIYVAVSSENMKKINSITINNCIFDQMKKGIMITTNLSDNSRKYLELSSVSITNSTFIRSSQMSLINLHDAYGQAGCSISYTMTNITVYESLAQNGRLIQMNRLQNTSQVLISNCLFSIEENNYKDTYMFNETCLAGSAVKTLSNNYMTGELTECERSGKINCIKLPGNRSNLFENLDDNDLTIKDHSSVIYTDRIGDPRWIK